MLSYLFLAAVVPAVVALPASQDVTATNVQCSSYTIINARGTGEPQGESVGFQIMNKAILEKRPGGKRYNVVYPAAWYQDSWPGTQDIIREIKDTLATSPLECFILEGYSQGATAVVDALSYLTGANFDAVKGIFLIGNTEHKSGLACNVDMKGGDTTKDVNGILHDSSNGIPDNWVSKSLDVCNFGDGVCDTRDGFGITVQHLAYPQDQGVQNMGTAFVIGKLGVN